MSAKSLMPWRCKIALRPRDIYKQSTTYERDKCKQYGNQLARNCHNKGGACELINTATIGICLSFSSPQSVRVKEWWRVVVTHTHKHYWEDN